MQKVIFIILIGFLTTKGFGQDNGRGGFSKDNFVVSARLQALAGQIGALNNQGVVGGAEVASIMQLNGPEVMLSHASIFKGLGVYEALYAQPVTLFGHDINAGIGLKYFDYGDFVETNQFGQTLGEFTLSDMTMNVFANWFMDKNVSFGASVAYSKMNLVQSGASHLGASINGTYRDPEKGMIFTADLRNHGFVFANSTGADLKSKPDWRLYASKKLIGSPFTFLATWTNLRQWDVIYRDEDAAPRQDPITGQIIPVEEPTNFEKGLAHLVLGSEIAFSDKLAFFLGYHYRKRQELVYQSKPGTVGVSWGAKLGLKSIEIEYARNKVHLSNTINSISLFIALPGQKKQIVN
ncbi:MAG: hypothetical protein ACJAY8_001185 [Sphingobacteriales bacterium]|jgi:hypothetical protein